MATLLYLVMEPDHGTVRFASAGHVPPLVIGPDGDAAVPRERAATRRSACSRATDHIELTAKLTPGSTIVLYTDGLVEERGVSIDQGLEALRLAAAQDTCHPDELCDRLVEAMLAIHPANDDIAVLALRALPDGAAAASPRHALRPDELGEMRRELGAWLRSAGRQQRGGRGDPDRLPRGLLELDRARILVRRRQAQRGRRARRSAWWS